MQAAGKYFKVMMNLFKTNGNSLRNYANKKLSGRINREAQNIFQDKQFNQEVTAKNVLFKSLFLLKSAKKFKQGAQSPKKSEKTLNNLNEFENDPDYIAEGNSIKNNSSFCIRSPINKMNVGLNETNSDGPHLFEDMQEPIKDPITKKENSEKNIDVASVPNSFAKEDLCLSEKMQEVNDKGLNDLKLLSYLKEKYENEI